MKLNFFCRCLNGREPNFRLNVTETKSGQMGMNNAGNLEGGWGNRGRERERGKT